MRRILAALLSILIASPAYAGWLDVPFTSALGQSNAWTALQTFSANIVTPVVIGGTGTTSTLTLQSTSGVGTTGADIIFKVGNNGATEAGRILNNGYWGIGGIPGYPFHIIGSSVSPGLSIQASSGGAGFDLTAGGVSFRQRNTGANRWAWGTSATDFMGINGANGYVAIGQDFLAPASLLDLRAGDLTFSGANGQKYVQGRATQLVAVGSGISTKATTIQIPADAIVYAVPVRVKTQPGGTTTIEVKATTSGTVFNKGATISSVAGTTDPGTKNTPVNYNSVAAQTVTFTFDAPTTDALGEIRVDIYYATSTPPTS